MVNIGINVQNQEIIENEKDSDDNIDSFIDGVFIRL